MSMAWLKYQRFYFPGPMKRKVYTSSALRCPPTYWGEYHQRACGSRFNCLRIKIKMFVFVVHQWKINQYINGIWVSASSCAVSNYKLYRSLVILIIKAMGKIVGKLSFSFLRTEGVSDWGYFKHIPSCISNPHDSWDSGFLFARPFSQTLFQPLIK